MPTSCGGQVRGFSRFAQIFAASGVHWGSSSWVDAIEARRLRPGEDHADATVQQITDLLGDLVSTAARHEHL
ncbi:MAG TPA: hypothetical protein VLW50_29145 [Streptosporangiaceae bacterium]|nr:hypothetical protein [Streptosporangiaceae bacterium]